MCSTIVHINVAKTSSTQERIRLLLLKRGCLVKQPRFTLCLTVVDLTCRLYHTLSKLLFRFLLERFDSPVLLPVL